MSETKSTEVKPISAVNFESIKAFQEFAQKNAPQTTRQGNILQVFMNMDMRYGHDGLEQFARLRHIDVKALQPGQYVVFVNVSQNRIKVYASNQIVAYMRLEKGRRVDLRVIQEIPRAFNASGRLDYDNALKEAVEAALVRKSSERITQVKEAKNAKASKADKQ